MTRIKIAYTPITYGMALCTWTACNVPLGDASSQQDAAPRLEPETLFDAGVATQPTTANDAAAARPSAADAAAQLGGRGDSASNAGMQAAGASGSAGDGEAPSPTPREAPGYIEELQEPADMSKKCVDVTDATVEEPASALEGRRIQFWECSKTPNPAQRWTFFDDHTIRAFDMCLTAAGDDSRTQAGGVMLALRNCRPGLDTQFWWLCGGQLLNQARRTCLDLMAEANRQDSGSVQLWKCYDMKPSQSWQLPGNLEVVREHACPEFPDLQP